MVATDVVARKAMNWHTASKPSPRERCVGRIIGDIALHVFDPLRQGPCAKAAIEHRDLLTGTNGRLDAGRRDLPGPADVEHFLTVPGHLRPKAPRW